MKTIHKILAFLFLFLWLIQSAGAEQSKQTLMERLHESKPAYTEAQVQAYVKEVLPLVEQSAGRKFKVVPKIKLVRRADLALVLTEELTPQYKRLYPSVAIDRIEQQAEYDAYNYSVCLMGKYGAITGKLYMLPRNLQPLMDLTEVDSKYRQQIVKLVIAHELAHALQDQYIAIVKSEAKIDTVEKSLAFSAAIEGYAMYVEDAVADKLSISDAAKEFARAIATGSFKDIDPAIEVVVKQKADLAKSIYIQGRDFIAWQFQHGGLDQVWRVLATPPTSTSEIYHPETYSLTAEANIDYAQVLKGLEKKIGKQKWTVVNSEVGEMEMKSIYASMEEKTRGEILSNIDHVQRLVATSDKCMVRLGFIILKDHSYAPVIISAVEKTSNENFKKMSESQIIKMETISLADFAEMKGKTDIARRVAIISTSNGYTNSFTFIQAARGRIVAYLSTQNISIPGTKVASILEEIFKKLPIKD